MALSEGDIWAIGSFCPTVSFFPISPPRSTFPTINFFLCLQERIVGGLFLSSQGYDSLFSHLLEINYRRKPPWILNYINHSPVSLFFSPVPDSYRQKSVSIMGDTLSKSVPDLTLGFVDAPIALSPAIESRAVSIHRFNLVVTTVNSRKQHPSALIGPISVHRWFPNITDDDMKIIPFWAQIRGITLLYLSNDTARYVGDQLGPVTGADFDENANMVEFIRLQISWNVDWPLRLRKNFQFVPDDNTLITYRFERFRNFCSNCGSLNHDVKECDLSLDNGNNDDFDLPDDDDPNEGDGDISVGMSKTITLHTIEPFGEISGVGQDRGLSRPNVEHGRVLFLMAMWVISYGTIQRLCKVTTFILMRMKKMEFNAFILMRMKKMESNGLRNPTALLRISKYFGYRRHDPEPLQATYRSIHLIRVMRKAFRSFIYKMIAFYKYMKRGLNRFYLLPVRLLLESRVTSTSSSKLGFNFLYLFQWLYLNGFMYHVSCKTFMK